MTESHPILEEIEAFLAIPGIGISATRFGVDVMNDGKFVTALRSGRRVWPDTENKVREYIRTEKERRILALGGTFVAPLSDDVHSLLRGAAAILDPGAANPTLSQAPVEVSTFRRSKKRRGFLVSSDRSTGRGSP